MFKFLFSRDSGAEDARMGISQLGDLISRPNNVPAGLVTWGMSVLFFVSFFGSCGLWLSFFVPWLAGSLANLATWALLLLLSCSSSLCDHKRQSPWDFMHRKHRESSGKCVFLGSSYRVWFSESSLGPRNLKSYKHSIWLWCWLFLEKHGSGTYVSWFRKSQLWFTKWKEKKK